MGGTGDTNVFAINGWKEWLRTSLDGQRGVCIRLGRQETEERALEALAQSKQ